MSSDWSHGGNTVKSGECFGSKKLIDFSANINPLGPSPKAAKICDKFPGSIIHYPEPYCDSLKQKIARHHSIDIENIIIGNGSAQLIDVAVRVLDPQSALIPVPAFSEYERVLLSAGVCIKFLRRCANNDFILPADKMAKAIKNSDITFLCNPNNPTGGLIPEDDLSGLIALGYKHKTFIVLDESFIEFCPGRSKIKTAAKSKHLVVLRSFSKMWGLPGLRAGYAVSHPSVIKKLQNYLQPWSVNALAQIAAAESLKDKVHLKRSVNFIRKEAAFLFSGLNKIEGLKPFTPSANFIFVKIIAGMPSGELFQKCGKKGIIIRDCSNYRGLNNKFIRVAVRARGENVKLLNVLNGVL